MTDFETWFMDYNDQIFRIKEINAMYYNTVRFVDVIELPDKDILVGYKIVESKEAFDNFDELTIFYTRLSQIEDIQLHYKDNN